MLLSKGVEFIWANNFDSTFTGFKDQISKPPDLHGIYWTLPSMDNLDIKDVLEQHKEKNPCVINENLAPTMLICMVTKKYFLAIVYMVNKSWHFMIGYSIFTHTDHLAIKHLMKKFVTYGQITICFLLLQNITINGKPKRDNVIANFFFRLNVDDYGPPIEDSFLDEHLFELSAHTS